MPKHNATRSARVIFEPVRLIKFIFFICYPFYFRTIAVLFFSSFVLPFLFGLHVFPQENRPNLTDRVEKNLVRNYGRNLGEGSAFCFQVPAWSGRLVTS
jgi:hypothetical protein